jgi:hypothetical protein
MKVGRLKYLTQPVDLVIIGLAHIFTTVLDLLFHEQAGVIVAGDIADGKIDALFDDQLVAADIRHVSLVLFLKSGRALIFTPDRVKKNVVGLFSKGKKA